MLWTALLLGLAGSLHCVGMCGPLMLAVPLSAQAKRQLWLQTLEYQAGRIATYMLLGLLFGLLGKGLALAGIQQILSVAAGALFIAAALFAFQWERAALLIPGMAALTHWVKKKISSLLRHNPDGAALGLGMLNGLLPCGLVYAALAGAMASAGAWNGVSFMLLFGLGTLPLLLILMAGGQKAGMTLRSRFKIVQPVLLAVSGILLLSRGLHLDLSLFESAVPPADLDCH